MEVLSFLDASHPEKYFLNLPLKYEHLVKSFILLKTIALNRDDISKNHISMFT